MNWKASKYQTFVCALQSECPEIKKKKTQGKGPCSRYTSVTLPYEYENQTPPQTFSETCSCLFAGELFNKTSLRDCIACKQLVFV